MRSGLSKPIKRGWIPLLLIEVSSYSNLASWSLGPYAWSYYRADQLQTRPAKLKRIWRVAQHHRPGRDWSSRVKERIERNALRGAPMICIRSSLAAAGLAIATAIPASAEIVASTCRLLSYDGPITSVETFRCDFMQRSGNVLVNSAEHEFSFLAAEQGKTCLLYTSPSPRDRTRSRMPSSA